MVDKVTKDDKEVWENPNAGYRYVAIQNNRGEPTSLEIGPRQKFSISTFDRIVLNQEKTPEKANDMFSNGTFSKVRLVETAEDYEELASNPNLLSETELLEMFQLTIAPFKKKLADIANVRVLDRLLELAQTSDSTTPQVNAIKKRLDEVEPERGKLPVFPDYTDGKPIPPVSLS